MPFFRQFQHLLPHARAWWLTTEKTLRDFFIGLTGAPSDARDFVDSVYTEIDPDTTTELAEWERQFGLFAQSDDTDSERAARIDVAWKNRGGQDPSYIQGQLQDAGFPVYIHDWWETPHDALEQSVNGTFDTDTSWTKGTNWTIGSGTANAAAALAAQYLEQDVVTASTLYRIRYTITGYVSGSVTVFAGTVAGTARSANGRYTEELTADGVALKFGGSAGGFTGSIDNVEVREVRIARDPRDYTELARIGSNRCSAHVGIYQPRCSSGENPSGTPITQWRCNAFLANHTRYLVNENLTLRAPPPIPEDPTKWPHFVYFGPETLTTSAFIAIQNTRRAEFERMVLQLCPMQDWIVVMTQFISTGVFSGEFDESFE